MNGKAATLTPAVLDHLEEDAWLLLSMACKP